MNSRASCPSRKAVIKQIQTQGSVVVFRQVFSRLIRLVKGKFHKLGYYHEEKEKNEFALKKLAYTVPFLMNGRHILLSLFLATTSSFMHDWSRHSILRQSRVPLYEKYITVIYALGSTHEEIRTPCESAAAPTLHSATDPAEFNVVCRPKPNLPNQTDSNAALLPYLNHQLGSAHKWNVSGVWNGPQSIRLEQFFPVNFISSGGFCKQNP